MTKIKSLGNDRQPGDNVVGELQLEDTTGIGQRFLEGFTAVLEQKKREAVLEVVKEEVPHLAQDEHFINQVTHRLGSQVIDEKRFVFLVLNPNVKK